MNLIALLGPLPPITKLIRNQEETEIFFLQILLHTTFCGYIYIRLQDKKSLRSHYTAEIKDFTNFVACWWKDSDPEITIYAPKIYKAQCLMFWMRAYPLRGQVGGSWALNIANFLGLVKWHRADRLSAILWGVEEQVHKGT
jgi:hypothetical protein